MKVYGYCRVSTHEQANSGLSLDRQKQQITGYDMMKGWAIAEFFVEAGVSASVPLADRLEGQRLLATLQPGDVVITAKLDRAPSGPPRTPWARLSSSRMTGSACI